MDRLIRKINSLTELELQTLMEAIGEQLRKNNQTHIAECLQDKAEVEELQSDIENLEKEVEELEEQISEIKELVWDIDELDDDKLADAVKQIQDILC